MDADPAESVLGETALDGWDLVRHDQSFALNTVPVPQEEAAGLTGVCYSASAGEVTYEVGKDSRLTNNQCDVVSDVDGDGSEDVSSDGSCSDSSDASSDKGGGVIFRDFEAGSGESEDEDWVPKEDDCDECDDGDGENVRGDSCANGLARRIVRNPSWRPENMSNNAEFPFQFASPSNGAGSPSADWDTSKSMGRAAAAVSEPSSGAGTGSRSSGSGDGQQQNKRARRQNTATTVQKKDNAEKERKRKEKKKEGLQNQFRSSTRV